MVSAPSEPRLPSWIKWVAGVAWIVTIVAFASIVDQSFWARLAREALRTIASVAFAVAGLGLVAERWSRRRWRQQTAYLAVDALDRVQDALLAFVACAFDVIQPGTGAQWLISIDARGILSVPTNPQRKRIDAALRGQCLVLRKAVTHIRDDARVEAMSDGGDERFDVAQPLEDGLARRPGQVLPAPSRPAPAASTPLVSRRAARGAETVGAVGGRDVLNRTCGSGGVGGAGRSLTRRRGAGSRVVHPPVHSSEG